jgi:translation initiation factor 5B
LSRKEQEKKDARDLARSKLIEQGLIDPEEFNKSQQDPNRKIKYSTKKHKKNKNKPEDAKTDLAATEEKKEEVEHEQTDVKEAPLHDTAEEEKEPGHSVKPGMEESADAIRKGPANEAAHEIDDELKLDDWEDMLDDTVADKFVKIQEENAPAVDAKIEQLLETTSTTVAPESSKTEISKDSKEAKRDARDARDSKTESKETTGGSKSIFERKRKTGTDKKKGKGKGKGKVVEEEDKEDDGEVRFRCPIICVLGHVDTGKTLLLDKIRKTNVQRGEAGGITQQIGATYFPGEALQKNMDKLGDDFDTKEVKIPGLLVIDTPGHESFTNLRSRGSNLCDLAVLVVDVMHGLEKQTLESIELLKKRKTPFIVALNKIDVTHGWEKEEYRSSKIALENQIHQVNDEYEMRRDKAFLQFNELGMNIIEYWKNDDPRTYISAVPTSAMTGEGIPDILGMIVKTTQKMLKNKILERNQEFACTVLEVKKISGVGTTVDVVLVNGKLSVGDTIVLAGFNGPIVTKIRALLTPYPMKEIRVKGEYIHHDSLYGAMGIKISAPELDYALAGGELFKAESDDQIEAL